MSNFPLSVRHGLAWFQDRGKCIVETNKDGGWCLIDPAALDTLFNNNLHPNYHLLYNELDIKIEHVKN